MTKEELRKKYKLLRSNYSDTLIDSLTAKCINILILNFNLENKNVGIFLPIKSHKEPNLFLLFSELKLKNTFLFAPKSQIETNDMIFHRIDSMNDVQIGPYQIPEPISLESIHNKDLDIILIPLLSFDSKGYRVGYGKGYYDKYLKNSPDKLIKIGISLFNEIERIDDVNSYDVQLNFCITPERLIKFPFER